MTEATPTEMSGVIPHLVCAGAADAIAFYKRAFGAEELMRLPTGTGQILHACLRINGGLVFLADEFGEQCHGSLSPRSLKGTPVSLHLVVADADAAAERAVAAGATIIMPVEDMFWGDRYGVVEDPFGHRWSLATPGRQLGDDELREAAARAMAAGSPAA